jgi:hypothetical protein
MMQHKKDDGKASSFYRNKLKKISWVVEYPNAHQVVMFALHNVE